MSSTRRVLVCRGAPGVTVGAPACTAPNAVGVCLLLAMARLAGLQVAQPGGRMLPGWGQLRTASQPG